MQKFRITPTLAINGVVCRTYPRVAQAAKDAGWEFMAHGWLQAPMHKVEDQKAAIRDTIEAIRTFTGKAPRGWESPGLTETEETIDHLAAAGIEYVANWVLDDQPVYIATATKPVVSIPYSVELNDIAMMVIQNQPAEEMLLRGKDHFDRLYEESAASCRVMAIAVHPYISGVPHRIRYLEELYSHILGKPGVVHWTGEAIMEWFRAQR
jgi:peptidoglycan/xylan/chitin deacetylase (PgdA/CDA1 family)